MYFGGKLDSEIIPPQRLVALSAHVKDDESELLFAFKCDIFDYFLMYFPKGIFNDNIQVRRHLSTDQKMIYFACINNIMEILGTVVIEAKPHNGLYPFPCENGGYYGFSNWHRNY